MVLEPHRVERVLSMPMELQLVVQAGAVEGWDGIVVRLQSSQTPLLPHFCLTQPS